MTRTVADAALLLTVHSGPEGRDPRQGDGVAAVDYRKALTGEVSGLRVGLLSEGFGQPSSQVDEVVRSAARRFTEIGCTVSEVSVPWHRHALAVFAVIFTDGATYQMLDGNGYGVGADGLYDPELMAYFASRRPRQRHAARSGSRNGREHRAAGCQRPPPAISVPAGLVDGLPVGMMIMGKRFDDATVLKVADAFEALCGGFPAAPGAARSRV